MFHYFPDLFRRELYKRGIYFVSPKLRYIPVWLIFVFNLFCLYHVILTVMGMKDHSQAGDAERLESFAQQCIGFLVA